MELKINEPWITSKVRCQNGYAYIDKPFWNAEKQCADHKREYIGKYDGETFTPNKTFHRWAFTCWQSVGINEPPTFNISVFTGCITILVTILSIRFLALTFL